MILRSGKRIALSMPKGISMSLVIFIILIIFSFSVMSILITTLTSKKSQIKTSSISPTLPTKKIQVRMNSIAIYFIAIGDAGKMGKKVGCGDSLIKINKQTTDTPSVQTAISQLLSIKSATYGDKGLYNALSLSSLTFQSVQIIDNVDVVSVTGKYFLGGVCDGPRLIEQIQATAREYSKGRDVRVIINGIPAEQLFSGKGEDLRPVQ